MKAKKLLVLTVSSILAAGIATAEIHPQKRYVEFGVDLTVGAMQNAFGIADVMVKDLVIDFTQLAEQLPDSGFMLNAELSPKVYASFDFKKFGFGAYAQVSANLGFGLSKDLFKVLGDGIQVGTESVTSVNVGVEAYVEAGVPIKMKFGRMTLRATPAVYVPLLYMPQPDATITIKESADGTITADAKADFALYSVLDTSPAFADGSFAGFDGILSQLQELDIQDIILNKGGIDLGLSAEFEVSSKTDLGVYAHVPIKAAELDYKTSGSASFSATVNPILDSLIGGGNLDYSFDGPTFSGIQTSTTAYAVNRPFRLGAELAWRPFRGKKWFVLTASGGVAATNPFGEDFDWSTSLYPEYNVSADLTILYVLGLNATSSYQNRVFTQSLGLKVNLRLLELDVSVGSSSGDFLKSWEVAGATAYVGVKVGF